MFICCLGEFVLIFFHRISFTERPNYNGEVDNLRKKIGNSPKNKISLDSADQNEQKSFKK